MLKNMAILLLLLVLTGCSQNLYLQGKKSVEQGQYDRAVDTFYEELRINPGNYRAWREIGVAFYKKGNWIKAEDAFKQANNIKQDARTNLYMGLIFEKRKQYEKAIAAYAASLHLKTEDETRVLIKDHLERLLEQKLKWETSQAIANESLIDVDTIPSNTVAVVNFDGSLLPDELAPLSLGLAEFTSVDLSKVSSLRVVDRIKIDIIQDELKLSSSKYADTQNAPRIGRLLGSSKIITGTVLSTGAKSLRLNGAVVSTTDSSTQLTETFEGRLDEFFEIQKRFVFKIIDDMEITLTVEERNAIKEVPTESFLAFMSYCRGLDFQSRGMPEEAGKEFEKAVSEDKNFQAADSKSREISQRSAMEGRGGESTEDFESSVLARSDAGERSYEFDRMHTATLSSSGFIPDRGTTDLYGNAPNTPPEIATGTVIIKGDLDAE